MVGTGRLNGGAKDNNGSRHCCRRYCCTLLQHQTAKMATSTTALRGMGIGWRKKIRRRTHGRRCTTVGNFLPTNHLLLNYCNTLSTPGSFTLHKSQQITPPKLLQISLHPPHSHLCDVPFALCWYRLQHGANRGRSHPSRESGMGQSVR